MGELVVAWPEHEDPEVAQERAEDGPLTWIETADGQTVRVPAEALAEDLADDLVEDPVGAAVDDAGDVPAGATVQVVLGGEVADDASVVDGVEPARDVLAAAVVEAPPVEEPPVLQASQVTNEVTVVMVVPAGGVQDQMTLPDVVAAVDGPVAAFLGRAE